MMACCKYGMQISFQPHFIEKCFILEEQWICTLQGETLSRKINANLKTGETFLAKRLNLKAI